MINYSRSVGLIILLLIILRSLSFGYYISDEMIYVNMANQVNQGLTPYEDFFFAHPPLFLALMPFSGSIIMLRLSLFFVQLIILLTFERILTHYQVSDEVKLLLLLLFVFSASFLELFNLYLGFGLTTMWCLLSYYYYLKGRHVSSVLFVNLAVCTRLFALFYLTGLILVNLRFKRYIYLLGPLLLVLFTLCYPVMLYDVFLYHVDAKSLLPLTIRLMVLSAFLMYDGVLLLLFFFKRRLGLVFNQELLIALCLLVGVSTTKISLYMYFSLVTPWLLLSVRRLRVKHLFYLLCFFIIIGLSRFSLPSSDYSVYCDLAINNSLPVSGTTTIANLLSYACPGVSLLGGEFDTSVYRYESINDLFVNNSYLLFCKLDIDRVTICDKLLPWRDSAYSLLYYDEFYAVYKHLNTTYS